MFNTWENWWKEVFGSAPVEPQPEYKSEFFDEDEDVMSMLEKATGADWWKMTWQDLVVLQKKVFEAQMEFMQKQVKKTTRTRRKKSS